MKIASLLASNTEIACALGLEDKLIGISHECDYPPSIKNKPVLTTSSIDPTKRSDEIDKDVRRLLQNALSIYQVNEELLKKLNPDIIMTQDQCEVCAVSLKDVHQALSSLGCHAKVISLKPRTLSDMSTIFKFGIPDINWLRQEIRFKLDEKIREIKSSMDYDAYFVSPPEGILRFLFNGMAIDFPQIPTKQR